MEFNNKEFVHYKESLGLTYKDIGNKLNLTQQAVRLWAKAPNKPRPNKVRELCNLFKIEVTDISDLKPDQETINKYKNLDKPTDCDHICNKLNDWEKDTLKRHISLELSTRKSVWKKWDTDISEAEKKSAACPQGSGHCEDTESIPDDLHREKIS